MAIRNRARRRYAIIATFVVLLAGLFSVALIQAQLVANQQRLDEIRADIVESELDQTRLRQEVEQASAPSAIIERAMGMGMVRATAPIYLAPSDSVTVVPVPISLGRAGVAPDEADQTVESAPVVAAADNGVVDVELVEATSVGRGNKLISPGRTPVVTAPSTAGSVDTGAGAASLAGTTAVSTGVVVPADDQSSSSSESALATVESAGGDGGAAPAWAGAMAEAGTVSAETG